MGKGPVSDRVYIHPSVPAGQQEVRVHKGAEANKKHKIKFGFLARPKAECKSGTVGTEKENMRQQNRASTN